ncbi:MAG: Gfo/Idh/MocA family oxidoreductase [Firmicutes bacterium]|nr:Gfo/Idh/MocA family oxidoreductase [Bacillota bacterium]MBR0342646.1 Gfo/Idh/MocA family oxidoreductase [Oscillospiraceae bacterium]MBR0450576.1 Gfo/Idh/MocA family oxidoreductase [Oscillospiraceae bacterium]
MDFLVVGLGSMGKRRARLLKGLLPDCRIFGVDMSDERREQASSLGITPFPSIPEALDSVRPDAALVCTSPVSHSGIIKTLLEAGLPVFTELNLLDDGYKENTRLAKEKGVPLFLSSTMLYRKETQYMKQQVDSFRESTGKGVNYLYHIGQYLPDWHPWETYKNFFVSDRRTGGVREILGIDLPWLVDLFGDAECVHVESSCLTDLEISYPDTITFILKHDSGTVGTMVVDVTSPKAVRHFECFGEGLHLFWEGSPKELYRFNTETKEKEYVDTYGVYEHDSRYSDNIVENAYVDELADFLSMLEKGTTPLWSFEKDQKVIDLINQIDM